MTRLSIRTRLALWYGTALAVVFAASTLAGYAVLHQAIHWSVDAALDSRAEGTARFLEEQLPRLPTERFASEFRDHIIIALGPGAGLVQVSDDRGRYIYRAVAFQQAGLEAPARPLDAPVYDERLIHGLPVRMLTTTVTAHGRRFVVQLGTPTLEMERTLKRVTYLMAVVVPLLLLAACGGGYWISGRALAPVDDITNAARTIGAFNLQARLPSPVPAMNSNA